jgi:type IV secretory pathway VirB2 component (pilin)
MQKMKKTILIGALLLLFAHHALAVTASFGNPITSTTISAVLTSIMSYLKTIAGTIAVIFIIIGGMMYMFSAGNKEMIERAKKTLIYAMAGAAIVIGASTIANQISTILGTSTTSSTTLSTIATNALKFLLSIAGTLAIISVVIGAIWMFTAAGDKERYELGKKTVIYAIVGVIITVGSLIIISQIKTIMGS